MTTPAQQVYSFQALIPAGTVLPSTVTIDCSFPAATVVGIRWRIPPGPSGFMGWAITSDGVNVIPVQQGTYIVGDDESDTWPVTNLPDAGNWQVTGYNADIYDHSVYIDFLTAPTPVASPSTPQLLSAASLSPAPDPTVPSAVAPISEPPLSGDDQAQLQALLAATVDTE